jgi:hypothetical protein
MDEVLWQDTRLPIPEGWPRRWTCALTGRALEPDSGGLRVSELFRIVPVTLLLADPAS